ncbi:FAD-dependent pyridine nucleotide-disulphide oxidoreductase [Catenulispora acidiphila DSM 44928]|uniref:FAD-dependent pyridine nucleotide-disulphide oxidoreductase n=1 Tax=Catenulispora acidiphila (strain DSM 44928 / JCM 14897 / NBRC 102108 / NRRL B-24433 / ID139908) TaxID=479433 RepID=C7PZA0_CATAD|nr:FAD-dependent oxidoreductase [Catenulispora acidiphila]ACU71557.1 FAD-dependent pyridine nucleotide-disulphide oxidoreductase [Catenulispora acidiphila DSM 44928]
MTENHPYVIVGGGLAGAKAAQALREQGFDGPVVLIGEETERPYERPPLSKGYLQGKDEREKIFVHPQDWYAEHDVELRLGTGAVALDTAAHRVELADGSQVEYAKLLLATGSSPRRLPIPGADLDGVRYLRRVEDSEQLKADFQPGARIVVIGAGWIGLEAAAAARAAGADVTVLEAAELPLLRVLGSETAQIFADLHRDHGVDLRCGVEIVEITGSLGKADGVLLGHGAGRIAADVVLMGVGITPNTALAESAGLKVDNGIVTDEHLRTSAPDVYAAGDAANAFHPFFGKNIRVEHWANALNQPQTAAKSMLGQDATYDRLPYFYTDQYDLGMEYTGHAEPDAYDRVVFRGDVAGREFIAFWLSEGRVLAGMNVNVWDVTDPIKALITSRTVVDPERLADPDVALESLVSS